MAVIGPLPYYRWHWQDYRANRTVQRMTYVERGLYRELLDECWSEGFITDDIKTMAEICGCPEDVMADAWLVLSKCFASAGENILVNPRMDRERTDKDQERASKAIAGKTGGLAKAKHLLESAKHLVSTCHIEEKRREENVPPLAPKGATKKTPKVELDCSPEAEESLRPVYQAWPTQDPNGGKAHKGPFAAAARAFQKIIDSGEATARELKGCGMLYAKAELYPDLKQRIMDAWEYRDQAIMHVSTFYGPEKKPYRQLLPLAREAIAHADEKAKQQQQPILLEAM